MRVLDPPYTDMASHDVLGTCHFHFDGFPVLLEPSILLAFFHHTEAGFIYPCHTAIFYGTCHAALLVPVPAPID
jgi:hypothetical protein